MMGILRHRIWNAREDTLRNIYPFTVAGQRIHALHCRKWVVGNTGNAERSSRHYLVIVLFLRSILEFKMLLLNALINCKECNWATELHRSGGIIELSKARQA